MRIDLNTPVTFGILIETATSFWQWWTNLLGDLLPGVAKAWLANSVEHWSVGVTDQHWQLRRNSREGEFIALDMAEPASVLQNLIERLAPGARERRLTVFIPASDVLTRNIRIPTSAVSHMRAVTKLQLERLSPFASETVHFDCRLTGAGAQGDTDVEIGIVQKATLTQYADRLTAIGLTARRFEVADRKLSFHSVRNTWTSQERYQVRLAGAAAATWILALLIAPSLRDHEVQSLSAELAALRGPALRAAAEHDELERIARPLAAASHLVAQPNALDVLELLTNSIPEDAQVTNLLVEKGSIRFLGIAKDPHAVVAALRRAGLRSVHLIASSPQDSGEQSFELAASIKPSEARTH